jgi:hypothetical protein
MHENAKSSKIVSNMKNVNIVQQQLELINSKLDFLTSVISDKYLPHLCIVKSFLEPLSLHYLELG